LAQLLDLLERQRVLSLTREQFHSQLLQLDPVRLLAQ
jgi:hypothetical protein